MRKRKSVLLIEEVSNKLKDVLQNHHCYAYRENTIINAAIMMFIDANFEEQKEYLNKALMKDGRLWKNK